MGLALPSASPAWTRPRRHTRHRALNPNGPEAAAYTTARLTGAYGRILRYVILASGENFNATLIRNGYAQGRLGYPIETVAVAASLGVVLNYFGFNIGLLPCGQRPARIASSMLSASVVGENRKPSRSRV